MQGSVTTQVISLRNWPCAHLNSLPSSGSDPVHAHTCVSLHLQMMPHPPQTVVLAIYPCEDRSKEEGCIGIESKLKALGQEISELQAT